MKSNDFLMSARLYGLFSSNGYFPAKPPYLQTVGREAIDVCFYLLLYLLKFCTQQINFDFGFLDFRSKNDFTFKFSIY